MKLTIDRKTWANGDLLTIGGEQIDSTLLDHSGSRCCLGFLGRACGIADDQMIGIGTPQFVPISAVKKWPEGVVTPALENNTDWTKAAIAINDAPVDVPCIGEKYLAEVGALNYPDVAPGDHYRERLLTAHFLKIGIELEFEG